MIWRASLENPRTKEILGFETIQDLSKYLVNLTGSEENIDEDGMPGNDLVT